MTVHSFLRATSALLGVSALFQKRRAHRVALTTSAIASQLFWSDPREGCLRHRIDAAIAKSTIVYCVAERVLRGPVPNSFFVSLTALFGSALASHRASRKAWCGVPHVVWHALLHVSGFISSLYCV